MIRGYRIAPLGHCEICGKKKRGRARGPQDDLGEEFPKAAKKEALGGAGWKKKTKGSGGGWRGNQ